VVILALISQALAAMALNFVRHVSFGFRRPSHPPEMRLPVKEHEDDVRINTLIEKEAQHIRIESMGKRVNDLSRQCEDILSRLSILEDGAVIPETPDIRSDFESCVRQCEGRVDMLCDSTQKSLDVHMDLHDRRFSEALNLLKSEVSRLESKIYELRENREPSLNKDDTDDEKLEMPERKDVHSVSSAARSHTIAPASAVPAVHRSLGAPCARECPHIARQSSKGYASSTESIAESHLGCEAFPGDLAKLLRNTSKFSVPSMKTRTCSVPSMKTRTCLQPGS